MSSGLEYIARYYRDEFNEIMEAQARIDERRKARLEEEHKHRCMGCVWGRRIAFDTYYCPCPSDICMKYASK